MIKRLTATLCLLIAMTAAHAQGNTFPYPSMPDTLKSADDRAAYLLLHYWDRFDFCDTLQLQNADNIEQGFVNYIDLIARLSEEIKRGNLQHTNSHTLSQSVATLCNKAFTTAPAKKKVESLISHYLDDPQSPMRDDRTYLLFLHEMEHSSFLQEAEKERAAFKVKTRNKNLPGDTALDFSFTDKEGKMRKLSDYKKEKVILYFYDPDCENCHRVTAWLKKQTIPADYQFLSVRADDNISELYSIEAMPTIYLLDKGNTVVLKDCLPETLMQVIGNQPTLLP